MTKSFTDRDTKRLFEREPVKKLGSEVQRAALRKLRIWDAATNLNDLRTPPGNRLEKLEADRAGPHSIRIVHGERSITADTALRLARYFGNSDRFWLNLQGAYDLDVEKDRLGDRLEAEVLRHAG